MRSNVCIDIGNISSRHILRHCSWHFVLCSSLWKMNNPLRVKRSDYIKPFSLQCCKCSYIWCIRFYFQLLLLIKKKQQPYFKTTTVQYICRYLQSWKSEKVLVWNVKKNWHIKMTSYSKCTISSLLLHLWMCSWTNALVIVVHLFTDIIIRQKYC